VPYYYAGIKMYDLVSGQRLLKSSYYINKAKTIDLFPMLKKDKLVGALIYYDGVIKPKSNYEFDGSKNFLNYLHRSTQ